MVLIYDVMADRPAMSNGETTFLLVARSTLLNMAAEEARGSMNFNRTVLARLSVASTPPTGSVQF